MINFLKKSWRWFVGLFVGTAIALTAVNFTGTPIVISPTPQPAPTYFAEIDKNGIVLRVIVITQEELNRGLWGDPKNWVQTSMDGSIGKNYAGKDFKYDKISGAFIPANSNPDLILDKTDFKWKSSFETIKTASQ